MDKLDALLFEAWERIGEQLRHDRIRALSRSRRRLGILSRPMRAWCLCIRASDTRINNWSALIHPQDAIEHQVPHTITLSGTLIRELTKPVTIPFPGVPYAEAAKLLGRDYQTLAYWAYKGVLKTDYYPRYRRPRNREPLVWTPSPIDPNRARGRAPHAVWGTLWQWLWEKLPPEYELVVRREPRFLRHPGKGRRGESGGDERFRGWYFVCPGRVDECGNYKGCGERCTFLFGPQSVWTLPQHLGTPGLPCEPDPIASSGGGAGAGGPRSFACKRCWRVRGMSWADGTGWNEFVSHISGGLLYGRDVPRPLDICPTVRKVAYKAKPDANRKRYARKRAAAGPGIGEASDKKRVG
jgi:hypothetical protein